ncbi:MAG: hypothetical protein K8F91_08040 [Candidatus Obscuribacterales bacterium]|nr:hypothetical protein [Candidatus Obscuribacterales bacterium]
MTGRERFLAKFHDRLTIDVFYDRVAKETGVPKESLSLIKSVKSFEIIPNN